MNEKYQKQKNEFLDSLVPDDFRNPTSFNQAEIIIDQLNKSLKMAQNREEFIDKAVKHLFRQGSPAVDRAINLSKIYLES